MNASHFFWKVSLYVEIEFIFLNISVLPIKWLQELVDQGGSKSWRKKLLAVTLKGRGGTGEPVHHFWPAPFPALSCLQAFQPLLALWPLSHLSYFSHGGLHFSSADCHFCLCSYLFSVYLPLEMQSGPQNWGLGSLDTQDLRMLRWKPPSLRKPSLTFLPPIPSPAECAVHSIGAYPPHNCVYLSPLLGPSLLEDRNPAFIGFGSPVS